ncbi:hypothetical protein IAU60_001410 [Kwoniella sp. DSM 27419]
MEGDRAMISGGLNTWTPIGQTPNQLILYHPPSHALQVRPHPIPGGLLLGSRGSSASPGPSRPVGPRGLRLLGSSAVADPVEGSIATVPHCPYCAQPLPVAQTDQQGAPGPTVDATLFTVDSPTPTTPQKRQRERYFQILEQAHEGSRPPSPTPSPRRRRYETPLASDGEDDEDGLDQADLPARGYYERFFKEEKKLGMGAEGSVYLATHVIGGNVLGTYAVKKIAVGRSKSYLFKMLREVRLLETLRHSNIIPYHHAWIDTTRFSSFGPSIVALHVLMMYATAGNLDTYLLNRSHTNEIRSDLSATDLADTESIGQLPKAERIKAFKRRRQSALGGKSGQAKRREETRGVLLLGVEEIAKLFGDVVGGLAFLHAQSILHLDLKCSNVLLHWEEGRLIPKALISDFGTSEEMLKGQRVRTGHTGTMEYMAPETLVQDVLGQWRPSDSHADMWSLGLILHKMLFLRLPYPDTEDYEALLREILAYPGFIPTPDLLDSLERRHIPRDLLVLLSKLVHLVPDERPSAERVKAGLKGLEDRARSMGFAKAGELVRRFVSPFAGTGGPSSLQNLIEPVRQGTNVDDRPPIPVSPVRTVLALPSPEVQRPSWVPADPRPQAVEVGRPAATRVWDLVGSAKHVMRSRRGRTKLLRGLAFCLKITSLLPQLSGVDLAPMYTIALLLVAMVDLLGEPELPTALSLGVLHFAAVLWAY